MKFDARYFLHAWKAIAAHKDRGGRAVLAHVRVDQFPHGVRLTATDAHTIGTAFVHALGESDPTPEIGEAADRSLLVSDIAPIGYRRPAGGAVLNLRIGATATIRCGDITVRPATQPVDQWPGVPVRLEGARW